MIQRAKLGYSDNVQSCISEIRVLLISDNLIELIALNALSFRKYTGRGGVARGLRRKFESRGSIRARKSAEQADHQEAR